MESVVVVLGVYPVPVTVIVDATFPVLLERETVGGAVVASPKAVDEITTFDPEHGQTTCTKLPLDAGAESVAEIVPERLVDTSVGVKLG
jgi:hypothetical protein